MLHDVSRDVYEMKFWKSVYDAIIMMVNLMKYYLMVKLIANGVTWN